MKLREYIKNNKEIYNLFIEFIDCMDKEKSENAFQQIVEHFKILSTILLEDKDELQEILILLDKISQNHHRYPDFISKIERILLHLSDQIKQTFTNFQIFDFFKYNKRILLFLFTEKIIIIDEIILNFILNSSIGYFNDYKFYFFNTIKDLISNEKKELIENQLINNYEVSLESFDEKCQKGENDFYICELIRNDSIEEFVSYSNRINLPLSTQIKHSIFETNPFLIKKILNSQISLIEYAAFFGSIQIIQYLIFNNAELQDSIWHYAIHSKNAELIHLLEEHHVISSSLAFSKCYKEAIKCHHNDIAEYIELNLAKRLSDKNKSIFHYHNYHFMPNLLKGSVFFEYCCNYDYIKLVKLCIENEIITTVFNKIKICIFLK